MELVNRTPAAAKFVLADAETPSHRFLVVTAKVTFGWDPLGSIQIDSQSPFPLFEEDEATPLGFLPSDVRPRADPVFEVILLGIARPSGGKPVTRRKVALTVGTVTREMEVIGDRVWVSRSQYSDPVPFLEMPLTFERAYGGTTEIMLDPSTPFPVSDPMNPYGRGYDAETAARDLGASLGAPPGYPSLPGYQRLLPNLEDPNDSIKAWHDAPTPVCWSTVPLDMGLRLKWAIDLVKAGQMVAPKEMIDRTYHRAHPDWIIPVPAPAAPVHLVGIGSDENSKFSLPVLRPVVDVMNGAEMFSLSLQPQLLVLLPEQRRFYLVYRSVSRMAFRAVEPRGLRLRLEEGWSSPSASPSVVP